MEGIEPNRAGWRTRILYWVAKRRMGVVPKTMKIRAHWPKWLEGSGRLDALIAAEGTVDKALKELAQLKVAARVGCPY